VLREKVRDTELVGEGVAHGEVEGERDRAAEGEGEKVMVGGSVCGEGVGKGEGEGEKEVLRDWVRDSEVEGVEEVLR
jgi:hypothetical protein